MKFGDFEIRTFVEQRFKLDGGAMYGIVPKTLWQKHTPADDNNLIDMVTNIFVVSAHDRHILIETGLGDTLSDREKKVYGITEESRLESGLASLGLSPEDIDIVVLTHLHTDHAGGAVKLVDGEYVPRFPKASYVVAQVEWSEAMYPDERTAAVYHKERLRALKDAGQLMLLAVNTKLLPGIKTTHTGGHTPGHFGIEMESGGQKVCYYSDIYPMLPHLRTAWVPATDLNPVETMDIKRKLLPTIVDTDVVLAFDHDVHTPLARIKSEGKGFVAEPVE
ncbi:MBL fold metallo-hydrolase [candidate division GN15 bacterium]|nr:MBL fold metallo-hydrolase [candidate division GN15 bacterium]